MEMRDDCSRDVVLEQVFFIRIGVLLSAFHFSVCNCGLKNRLWFLMEGRWLRVDLLWSFPRKENEGEHAHKAVF